MTKLARGVDELQCNLLHLLLLVRLQQRLKQHKDNLPVTLVSYTGL